MTKSLDEKPEEEEKPEEKAAAAAAAEIFNEIKLNHLPPIVINFNLPTGYPSSCIPDYTISCKWLTVKKVFYPTLIHKYLEEFERKDSFYFIE